MRFKRFKTHVDRIDHLYKIERKKLFSCSEKEKLRLQWILERDPFYYHTWDKYKDYDVLKRAGWFDAGYDLEEVSSYQQTTPLNKIKSNINKDSRELAVILLTGCFAPLHQGHLSILEKGKSVLEERNFQVVGGFISSGHDQYVQSKGDNILPSKKRIEVIESNIKENDWIEIEPWEALHVDRALNFTEVILNLEFNMHLFDKNVRVFYLFGGDNAEFSKAFLQESQAICVTRQGYQDLLKKEETNNSQVIFYNDEFPEWGLSSTEMRQS